jgi:hypothetical protein
MQLENNNLHIYQLVEKEMVGNMGQYSFFCATFLRHF